MMGSMRKMASGFVAKVLMLFLVVSFALWGISDIFRDSSSNYAANVGSETISLGEFARGQRALAARMEAMGASNVNRRALDMAVLRQLVQQRLVNITLSDMGLYTNTSLLAQTLRDEPLFKNKDGSFNKQRFTAMLVQQRISETELLSQLKDEVNSNFLNASMDSSDLAYPDNVRALSIVSALETRNAWIVTISPAAVPTLIDNAALTAFYEKNKAVLYVKPESRTLEYVALKPQQLDALVDKSITPAIVAEAQKLSPTRNVQEIKIELRNTQREKTLHDLQAALDDALAGGANFAQALAKTSIGAPITTLKDVSEKSMKSAADDIAKTVMNQGFQMGNGETSGIVLSTQGIPLIVHVAALKTAEAEPYASVASDVHDRVAEQLRRDDARARVGKVKDALSKLTGSNPAITQQQLEAALAPFGLRARLVVNLSRNGASGDIPPLLRHAIFERPVGAIAGPLTLPSGSDMLAVVSALNHPDAAAAGAHNKRITDKERAAEAERISQAIQASSFSDFSAKHRVKLNARLLNAPANDAVAP